MYTITREPNGELRSNLKCKVCESPFEFIDDKNGFATVKHINIVGTKEESMGMDITAKCPICKYRAIYYGELKL